MFSRFITGSDDAIRALMRADSITGLHVIEGFPPFICDSCEFAKTTCKPICKERTAKQAEAFRDEIHTDVWGPSPTLSLGGRRYYVLRPANLSQSGRRYNATHASNVFVPIAAVSLQAISLLVIFSSKAPSDDSLPPTHHSIMA
jgi:hypothetical protein